MRVLLTLATLSGAISGSAALLPVVASDFLSINGAEPVEVEGVSCASASVRTGLFVSLFAFGLSAFRRRQDELPKR